MRTAVRQFVLAGLLVVTQWLAAEPAAFFKTYCLKCHNEEVQKGEFRLDTLKREFGVETTAQDWAEVLFRINSGEMPPKKEKQPTAAELGKVAEWISQNLEAGRAERLAKRGPVALYRLSRDEYANTVADLLGVHFDVHAPGTFNEDPRWHGFNRIGSLLSLSPSHVERYFEAAQQIVTRAFPEREPQPAKGRVEASDARAKQWQAANGVKDPVRMLILPGLTSRGAIRVREPGRYRIRVQLSALPSFKGRLPRLSLWDGKVKRSLSGRDVLAEEGKPIVVELEADLPAGSISLKNEAPGTFEALTLALTQRTPFTHTRERRFTHPSSYKLYKPSGEPIFPMLLVDWFEWEGPLLSDEDRRNRAAVFPKEETVEAARASLAKFLERAWRRPAHPTDLDRFLGVLQAEQQAGESFASAYRATLVAALTSRNFYYLAEGQPGAPRPKVNDWELASRLSYFLWGSMPDETLRAAARTDTLHRPEVLRANLRRMLADPKAGRFLDTFPKQWLQLHKVGMFPPDENLYPDYDPWLEKSMILESTEYFRAMFKGNRPLSEFLHSDWTVLNARLAMHYGLPPIKQAGFTRVNLPAGNARGGVLTHASVLSLTSDGTRHRPVHRGVWVSEAIYARPPPPPPPNVEPLAPTPSDQPKATIREQLEAHATHATCASCHAKIDPLGFAFDNFNAIGQWRTEENVTGGEGANPPVNAAGKLPNGQAFAGPVEFKQLLAQDLDRFAEAFVEQLATFALRRMMTVDDRTQIKAIAQAAKQDGYQLRTLIEHFVMSDLFVKR
jgi:hypothetical protein